MPKIALTQGKFATIDYSDCAKVLQYTWCAVFTGSVWYASTTIDGKHTYMHHFLIGKPKSGYVTDHKDRDGLNNRRKNLRHVPKGINTRNADVRIDSKSRVRGVEFVLRTGRYRAYIRQDGRKKHLGYFASADEAAAAYVSASKAIGV